MYNYNHGASIEKIRFLLLSLYMRQPYFVLKVIIVVMTWLIIIAMCFHVTHFM